MAGPISKPWVVVADVAVDPDSPIDAALMFGLRDDTVHLREWLGADYTGGAVQNHNHDGANSAAISGEVASIKPWPGLVLPSGNIWDWTDGGTLSRVTNSVLFGILMKEANVTISNAAPAVVTWAAHGLRTNMPIKFFSTGGLPTGITAGTHGAFVGTWYYVKVIDANTFNIAATPGGANINTSSAGSGVHTGTVAPHGDGDGATTFNKPDIRGTVPVGRDDMGGVAANRITSGGSGILGNVPGARGGAETVTLSQSQLPGYNLGVSHNAGTVNGAVGAVAGTIGSKGIATVAAQNGGASITVSSNGSNAAHQNVQPAGIYDWIIRIA